jgi:hypothetical protein
MHKAVTSTLAAAGSTHSGRELIANLRPGMMAGPEFIDNLRPGLIGPRRKEEDQLISSERVIVADS